MPKKIIEDMIRNDIHKDIFSALFEFNSTFIYDNDNNKEIVEMLRGILMPDQGSRFYETDHFDYNLFNPIPENTFERAVSGFLSYHISPVNKYFNLESVDFLKTEDEVFNSTIVKAQSQRTDSIHKIIQESSNFASIAQNTRDKLGLGMTARVIEDDDQQVAKMYYYPVEDLGIATSNGRNEDIFIVREKLNRFEARQRFPNPIIPNYWEERPVKGIIEEADSTYCRINIPLPVVKRHIMDHLKDQYDKTTVSRVVNYLFKNNISGADKSTLWADIWISETDILSIDVIPYRRIIVPKASPPYRVKNYARGQGEKALPLILTLTELDVMNLDSYEKTYTPAWSVTDDIQRLGLDLSRGKVTFKEKGMDDPTPLSLKADVRFMIEFKQFKQALLDRMFYLDMFELKDKSRMPSNEVDMRHSDDLRKAVLFVIQDHKDDLNPTVLTINNMIHHRLGKNDSLAGRLLRAYYTSELAASNKDSLINKAVKVLGLGKQVAEVVESESDINDEMDFVAYYKTIVSKLGETKALRVEKDAVTKRKQKNDLKQLKAQQARGLTLEASGRAITANTLQEAPGQASPGGVPGGVQGG